MHDTNVPCRPVGLRGPAFACTVRCMRVIPLLPMLTLCVLGLSVTRATAAEPEAPTVFEAAAVDEVPVPVLQPKPALPAGFKGDKAPPPVDVSLVVDGAGVVREAKVVTPGQFELDTAAVAILAKWRYRPGRKDGKPVATRLIVPVAFAPMDTEPAGPFAGPVIVPVEELDRAPLLRYQETPVYPPDLRRRGIGGEVLIEFVIDERGIVRSPRVLSAPHQALGEAAENAVGQWTFFPGMKGGRAVATRLQVPIEFAPPR